MAIKKENKPKPMQYGYSARKNSKPTGIDNKVATRRMTQVKKVIKNSKPTEPVTKGLMLGPSKKQEFLNRISKSDDLILKKALKANPKTTVSQFKKQLGIK